VIWTEIEDIHHGFFQRAGPRPTKDPLAGVLVLPGGFCQCRNLLSFHHIDMFDVSQVFRSDVGSSQFFLDARYRRWNDRLGFAPQDP
jgi:hypothetical protein